MAKVKTDGGMNNAEARLAYAQAALKRRSEGPLTPPASAEDLRRNLQCPERDLKLIDHAVPQLRPRGRPPRHRQAAHLGPGGAEGGPEGGRDPRGSTRGGHGRGGFRCKAHLPGVGELRGNSGVSAAMDEHQGSAAVQHFGLCILNGIFGGGADAARNSAAAASRGPEDWSTLLGHAHLALVNHQASDLVATEACSTTS